MNKVLNIKVGFYSYNPKPTLGSYLHDLQSNISATMLHTHTHKKKVAVGSVFWYMNAHIIKNKTSMTTSKDQIYDRGDSAVSYRWTN